MAKETRWSTSSTSLNCQEKLKQLRILQSINLMQRPLLSWWARDPLLKSFLQGLMKRAEWAKKNDPKIIQFPWLPLSPDKNKVLSGAGQKHHFPPVPHQFMKLLMMKSEAAPQEQLVQNRCGYSEKEASSWNAWIICACGEVLLRKSIKRENSWC